MSMTTALFSRAWNHGRIRRNDISPACRWTTSMPMAAKMKMNNCATKGKEKWLGKSIINSNRRRLGLPPLNVEFDDDFDVEEDMVPFEAILDEEFWAAARLKVECLGLEDEGNIADQTLKRMYVRRLFNMMREFSNEHAVRQSKCFLMYQSKNEDGSRKTVAILIMNIGFVSYHPKPTKLERIRYGDKYGYISFLYVTRSARRQGIATTMLHHAISYARNLGLERVFLKVVDDCEAGQAAIALYEKVGFQVVNNETSSYFNKDLPQPLVMCFQF